MRAKASCLAARVHLVVEAVDPLGDLRSAKALIQEPESLPFVGVPLPFDALGCTVASLVANAFLTFSATFGAPAPVADKGTV